MNKKLLDLLEKINAKKDEVKNLANEGKLEEAKKAKDELKELQDKFDILKDLDDGEAVPESKVPAGTPKDSTAEFAQAARNGFRVKNSMNEGTEADGGYTVPNDIQTRINKYKEAKFSLGQLVRKESVKTVKGSIGTLNAFEEDLTIYRAIEREDVKVRDEKAFVNGYLLLK